MGGLVDTANFIKEKEDDYMFEDVKGKRVDHLFIRANETIEVISIGICSAINEKARAYLTITDFLTERRLHTQTMELEASTERLYSYYKLTAPVKFVKNHFYRLEVEVFGGATYTYTDTLQLSTHRDLMIELTRESSKRISSLNTLTSLTDLSDSVSLKKASSKADSLLELSEETSLKKRRSTRKPKSNNTLDHDSEKKTGRKGTMIFHSSMPQLDAHTKAKFKKMLHSPEAFTNMNLISGIVFRRQSFGLDACLNR